MSLRRLRSAALCALLLFTAAHAQTVRPPADPAGDARITLTGVVLDDATSEPVPGAIVRASGTPLGTSADADGLFSLGVPPRVTTLDVSALGYSPRSVDVTDAPLAIRLVPATTDLQPVVVTAGRGAQARADAPLAIAALSAADIQATRPNLLAEALNRVPGVHTSTWATSSTPWRSASRSRSSRSFSTSKTASRSAPPACSTTTRLSRSTRATWAASRSSAGPDRPCTARARSAARSTF